MGYGKMAEIRFGTSILWWVLVLFPLPSPAQERLELKRLSLQDLEQYTAEKSKLSALEDLYSGRVVEDLMQYGYDLFDGKERETGNAIPAGSVQDDYILSAGDSLEIVLRGQENSKKTYTVDNQGLLIADSFPPVTAAGKTIKDVREELQGTVSAQYNTQIYLSLSAVRQIDVAVIGHVKQPGLKMLTAFHTVFDALNAGGGIEKTGSLRQIKLVRGGKTEIIDL